MIRLTYIVTLALIIAAVIFHIITLAAKGDNELSTAFEWSLIMFSSSSLMMYWINPKGKQKPANNSSSSS